MQQMAVDAEIHFHEQELVSIFHETNVANKEEEFEVAPICRTLLVLSLPGKLGHERVQDAREGHRRNKTPITYARELTWPAFAERRCQGRAVALGEKGEKGGCPSDQGRGVG